MALFEQLSVDACLGLLARHRVGRLGFDDGEGPVIHPVNYVLDRGSVVVRTDPGVKLDVANHRDACAFEIDGVDHLRRLGWSVLVRGRLTHVADPAELERLAQLEVGPYPGGDKRYLLRLDPGRITGRRIVVPPRRPGDRLARVSGERLWHGRDGDDLLA
jgi:uncharacterized protein